MENYPISADGRCNEEKAAFLSEKLVEVMTDFAKKNG
jgi:hypothetical protein